MAKKSLSEELSSLSNPQTDFDIEDEGLRDNVFDHSESEGESDDNDNALRQEHYVSLEKSKLRQQNDQINLGSKYKGAVASRDNVFGDEEDDKEDEEEDEEEDDEEDEEEEDDDEGELAQNQAFDDEESDSIDLDQEESESESGESSDESVDNKELEHNRSKIKELMKNERSHIVNRLSLSATTDALKGYAIQEHNKVFDKILDARIKLQKALTSTNLLPPNHDTLENQDLRGKKTEKYLERAKGECYDLLDKIMEFRTKIMEKDLITTSAPKPTKRTFDEYLKASNAMDASLNSYRSAVLTKWSAKIQNLSGSSAINAGKFRAINQSFEQQVQNNLTDMARLVKRTKLNRRKVVPLGYEYYRKQTEPEASESEEEEENPDIPKEAPRSTGLAELDVIFDDEDFYRILLNDLVDKKIQTANPTSGMTISLRNAQQAQKFKKNVDTKASKGRKLRYTVQEQIANFDAPRSSLKWNDDQIDEFFASLLGQKINMNESEEEEEEEEEDLRVDADTIKLFG